VSLSKILCIFPFIVRPISFLRFCFGTVLRPLKCVLISSSALCFARLSVHRHQPSGRRLLSALLSVLAHTSLSGAAFHHCADCVISVAAAAAAFRRRATAADSRLCLSPGAFAANPHCYDHHIRAHLARRIARRNQSTAVLCLDCRIIILWRLAVAAIVAIPVGALVAPRGTAHLWRTVCICVDTRICNVIRARAIATVAGTWQSACGGRSKGRGETSRRRSRSRSRSSWSLGRGRGRAVRLIIVWFAREAAVGAAVVFGRGG
jgi:hypothetical protein